MIPDFLAPFRAQLERYALPSIRINATPLDEPGPASKVSKFGGLPHLPVGVPYPTDPSGAPLLLLAQLNLEELPPNDWLPTAGLLQFYVPAHDWYDAEDSQVVYLGPEQFGTESSQDFSFLPATHYDESPIECEHHLTFLPATEYGGTEDYRFDMKFGELDSYDYAETLSVEQQKQFMALLGGTGHKLGGYADFTQGDRRKADSAKTNDVQLLQIDVDDHIMFGDSGVAHFFIDEQALRDRQFEKAYFYWDCC